MTETWPTVIGASIRRTNLALVVLGLVWAAFFAVYDVLWQRGSLVRSAESWQTEHTVTLLAAVVGLLVPRLLRPSHDAAETLVQGRLEGWRDGLVSTLPTLAAAVVLLATMESMFPDFRCCFCGPPAVPWDSFWSFYYVVPALTASLVAASGPLHRHGTGRTPPFASPKSGELLSGGSRYGCRTVTSAVELWRSHS